MPHITDNRLKIAFLTAEPVYDKRSHSGSLYYMGKALERYCGEVTYLESISSWERRYAGRFMNEVSSRLLKKTIAYKRLLFVAKRQSSIATRLLAEQSFDVIFAPNGVPEIAFLQTNIPIVLSSDITFCLQRGIKGDYPHPEYSQLLSFSARQGEMVERAAFQKAAKLLFSSSWAAHSAIEDYRVDPRKVHAVFWGANLDRIPPLEHVLAKKLLGKCRLLFVGVGWERKGGDIAFETLLALHEMDIDAELIVCGCTPPPHIRHPYLKVIPFLDKNNEQQAHQIEILYADADFLILPTRVDCVPNVFGEANAFGVPIITSAIGAVKCAIREGKNGYVLPYEASGRAYAEIIAHLYQDEEHYRQLVQSSRTVFDTYLNWETWGMTMKNILAEI